jgi:hypothetical protein
MKEKSEKQQLSNLTEDTLGGQLKAGLAQYLALEFTKGGQRDSKAIVRFLPWLYNPPTSVQQGSGKSEGCLSKLLFLLVRKISSIVSIEFDSSRG